MVFIRKNRNFNTKTRFSFRKQQFTSKIVLYSGKLSFIRRNRFTVGKMVFIRKSRNFNTKTRFSCRKQQFTSKIVLYSGKLSFYQKKRKFYVENEVFQRKFFRNAVLQWRRWFLSGQTEILTRKRGFLVENSSLHLKQYFIVENSVFIRRNENFSSKTMFSRENFLGMPFYSKKFSLENFVFDVKFSFLLIKTFTSKTKFSRENFLGMPFYIGEDGFYQEKQKF